MTSCRIATWVGVALTLGWLLFATNAVNFIDGLNGLAGGCTLVACLFAVLAAPRLLGTQAGAEDPPAVRRQTESPGEGD